jgi:prophage antirepressor-like protein
MNSLTKNFVFESHPVTVIVDKDGEVWFDATQVCEALGYERSASHVIEKLDDDEKKCLSRKEFSDWTESVQSLEGGAQFKNFVSEPGTYKLIFQSRKEEAKRFTRFVTHEILPEIRKTGSYAPNAKEVPIEKISDTFCKTKKMALANGASELEARRQAREMVRQKYGVNVNQLLGVGEPKEVKWDEKETQMAQKILSIVEKLIEKKGQANHREVLRSSHLKTQDLDTILDDLIDKERLEEKKRGTYRYYFPAN